MEKSRPCSCNVLSLESTELNYIFKRESLSENLESCSPSRCHLFKRQLLYWRLQDNLLSLRLFNQGNLFSQRQEKLLEHAIAIR